MPIDLGIGEMVKQLETAGLRPSEKLVQNILRSGDAAVDLLLDLALDSTMLFDEPPRCYGPIHALRLLGELPSLEIIEPLLEELPLVILEREDEAAQIWANEVPQIIARRGAAAIEPLWAIADDPDLPPQVRSSALDSLSYITAVVPESRDAIIAGMRERLGSADDLDLTGAQIIALGNLGVAEVYPDVLKLYRANKVNTELIPPSVARQLLLTPGEKRVACARHPLWERYDEHGPVPAPKE